MHHNFFWWVTAVLSVLTLATLYAQFVVGDDDKPIRDRLEHWYETLKQSDWTGIPLFAMRSVERFLTYIFGPKIVSTRFILLAAGLDIITNATSWLIYCDIDGIRPSDFSHSTDGLLALALLITNVVIDMSGLILSRSFLRYASKSERPRVLRDLIAQGGIAFTGIFAVMMSYILLLPITTDEPITLPGPNASFAADIYLGYITHPGLDTALLFGQAAFSALLILVIYFVSVAAYVTRPLTQRPLTRLVERLAHAKSGVLPTILGGLGALSAFVAVFKD